MNEWFEAERHVERAHELYEAGRWEDAASELREALSRDPSRADWHFNLGLTLEAAGQYAEALKALARANSLQPEDPNTLTLLGLNSLRTDDPHAAAAWLEAAHRADTARTDPLVHLIEAYARLGDHDKAEQSFYLAIQIDPDHAGAYANIAESLMDRARYDRAAYCFERALRLDPRLPRLHARLAAAYTELGRLDKARDFFLRELRDAPGDIETLLDFSCLLVRMGRLADASEKLRRVLEIDPEHPEARFRLADLALHQQRPDEAASELRHVLHADPEYPGARRRLARLAIAARDLGEARRLLRADLRAFRRVPKVFETAEIADLADLLMDARLPRDAADAAAVLVEREPQSAAAWHTLAVCAFKLGNHAGGMDAERRALRLEPRHLAALHNMALACIHAGQWSRAERFLDQARRIDSDDDSIRRLRFALRARRALAALRWLIGRR